MDIFSFLLKKPRIQIKKARAEYTTPSASSRTPISVSKSNHTELGLSKNNTVSNTKIPVKKSELLKSSVLKISNTPLASGVPKPTNKINKTESSSSVGRAKNISNKNDTLIRRQTKAVATQKRIKPNAVLDTFHNVTVSSPPPVRKKSPEKKEASAKPTKPDARRVRTNTRTLEPEEVLVLRNDSAKQKIEAEIKAANNMTHTNFVKDPVAFEINFESNILSHNQSDDETNYSDDFESYESDFESDSHSSSAQSHDSHNDSIRYDATQFTDESETQGDNVEDEESEPTQNPVTVIQRQKFLEGKFDSGHYDVNLRAQDDLKDVSSDSHQQVFDSLETFSGMLSEQLDSGISSCRALTEVMDENLNRMAISFGGYSGFLSKPICTVRGTELMSKIKFDTLVYSLFELKPISYDNFMHTYGKLHTTQSHTQTQENFTTSDCQTDEYEVRSKWTQHPPRFDLKTIKNLNVQVGSENGCGEAFETRSEISIANTKKFSDDENIFDPFSLRRDRNLNFVANKSTDCRQLQLFLTSSANLVLKVLSITNAESQIEKIQHNRLDKSNTGVSKGYRILNTNFLNALQVVHVFANSKHNLVITVLESLPEADVYRSDFSNLLMVWSTNDTMKPKRLLSTWSKVCRVEICNDMQDIVVCGLRDGSIAMWDLRETYSFCSKLDGHLMHFAATQSVAPVWNETNTTGEKTDLGAVIDIKSFPSRRKVVSLTNQSQSYKTLQFASLNDSGVVFVWTLVEVLKSDDNYDVFHQSKEKTKVKHFSKENVRYELSSPWARVKLVQSASCDLRFYLERYAMKTESNFERAKFLFEKNIYSDEVLREVNKSASLKRNTEFHGLRFSNIDTGYDSIYICTNRNFVLICSKSLKQNKFRQIFIDENRFLFPTALKLLSNEDFLAIGLSNGSVMILNCNQQTFVKKSRPLDSSQCQNTTSTPDLNELISKDLEIGKSCAIQNIILKERTSFEKPCNQNGIGSYHRPKTATISQSLTTKEKPFETRGLDQQLLLSGCMLRKHLVQSLELSSDGRRLFALSDGNIRCYDFEADREVTLDDVVSLDIKNAKVINIAIAQTSMTQQHLIFLTNENIVKMHILGQ